MLTINPQIQTAFETAKRTSRSVCEKLEATGIRLASTLSPHDLGKAAVNAYTLETSYEIPVLTERWQGRSPQYMQEKYVNLLQEISLTFYRSRNDYVDPMAEIVGNLAAYDLSCGNKLINTSGSSRFNDCDTDSPRFYYRHELGTLVESIKCPMFEPGAGYRAIADLNAFRKFPGKVILNDKNRFVSQVLKHTCKSLDIQNIEVIEGGFEKMEFDKDSIAFMIVSLVYSAGEQAIGALLKLAHQFMMTDGILAFKSTDIKRTENDVHTALLKQLVQNNGFAIFPGIRRPRSYPQDWFDRGPHLLELDYGQLNGFCEKMQGRFVESEISAFLARKVA